jgi:glycosyltransferase involved in cell wall biosynthesis
VSYSREQFVSGREPWILSVGNHSRVKGHDRFFRLVDGVAARIPVQGAIIGGSHSVQRFGLSRMGLKGGCWYSCRIRALFSSVRLFASMPREKVCAAMRLADVIVISSRREAYPIVILEAMAAGTPWVAFDVGSIREMSGGITVSSEDELQASVIRLLINSDFMGQLGAEGRRRVELCHNWESIARKYEEMFLTGSCGRGIPNAK